MNGAVYAATAKQAAVSSVDDRVYGERRDIGLNGEKLCSHRCSEHLQYSAAVTPRPSGL